MHKHMYLLTIGSVIFMCTASRMTVLLLHSWIFCEDECLQWISDLNFPFILRLIERFALFKLIIAIFLVRYMQIRSHRIIIISLWINQTFSIRITFTLDIKRSPFFFLFARNIPVAYRRPRKLLATGRDCNVIKSSLFREELQMVSICIRCLD